MTPLPPAWLTQLGMILFYATAVFSTAFVVTYWYLAPWWKTLGGWFTMELSLALATVCDLGVLRILLGVDSLAFMVVRTVVFAAIPLALARRIVLLVRLQIRSRRDLER